MENKNVVNGNNNFVLQNVENTLINTTVKCDGDFHLGNKPEDTEKKTFIVSTVKQLCPRELTDFLNSEHWQIKEVYDKGLEYGKIILELLSDSFEEGTYNENFSSLIKAQERLKHRKNDTNFSFLVKEIKAVLELVIVILKDKNKESPLENLYYNAQEAKEKDFIKLWEKYLIEYLLIFPKEELHLYPKWSAEKKQVLEELKGKKEEDLVYTFKIQTLKKKWLRTVPPKV